MNVGFSRSLDDFLEAQLLEFDGMHGNHTIWSLGYVSTTSWDFFQRIYIIYHLCGSSLRPSTVFRSARKSNYSWFITKSHNLGAGKSTLVNYVLKEKHGKRIPVILNKFREEVGVERALLTRILERMS